MESYSVISSPSFPLIEARVTAPGDYPGGTSSGANAGWYFLGFGDSYSDHFRHDAALSYSAVWACVRVISQSLAATGWHVYTTDGKRQDRLPLEDDVAWVLEMQASPEMTALAFREVMLKDALTFGNGYAEIERDGFGRVRWLYRLEPSRVQLKRDEGRLYYEVSSGSGHETIYLAPENVFHLKGLSEDGLVGYSVIAMARKTIELGMQQEKFGSKYFSRGPMPGGILKIPGNVNPEAKKEARTSFESTYGGAANAGRVVVLTGGMDFAPLTIPNADAQYLESRKFQVTEICRWYGVPPHKLGDLDRATFSNIEEQERAFVTDCLLPWARRLESEADVKLFGRTNRGKRFTKLNLDALMRGNSATQTSTVTSKVTSGLMTINEGREYFDLNPIDGGNTPLIQGAMTPLERILEEPEPPPPPMPPASPAPPPVPPAPDAGSSPKGGMRKGRIRAGCENPTQGDDGRFTGCEGGGEGGGGGGGEVDAAREAEDSEIAERESKEDDRIEAEREAEDTKAFSDAVSKDAQIERERASADAARAEAQSREDSIRESAREAANSALEDMRNAEDERGEADAREAARAAEDQQREIARREEDRAVEKAREQQAKGIARERQKEDRQRQKDRERAEKQRERQREREDIKRDERRDRDYRQREQQRDREDALRDKEGAAKPEALLRVFAVLLTSAYTRLLHTCRDKAMRAAKSGQLARHVESFYSLPAAPQQVAEILKAPFVVLLGDTAGRDAAKSAALRHVDWCKTQLKNGVPERGVWDARTASAVAVDIGRIRAGCENPTRDDDGKFTGCEGSGDGEGETEDDAIETAREKEDAAREAGHEKEDAARDVENEKEDDERDAAREKEDAERETAREKEDNDAAASSEKEDAAIFEAREREDAAVATAADAREAAREKSDQEYLAAIDQIAERQDTAEAQTEEWHDRETERIEQEQAEGRLNEAQAAKEQAKADATRQTQFRQHERQAAKERAELDRTSDKEDARREAEDARVEKEETARQAARDKEDDKREAAREKEDAQTAAAREKEDDAREAAREKEDKARNAARLKEEVKRDADRKREREARSIERAKADKARRTESAQTGG